jgi:hypothetical protein
MKSRVKGAACHSWIALFSYLASHRVSPTSLLHDASCKYYSKLHADYTLLPLPKTTFSLALPFTRPQRRSLSDSFSNGFGTVGPTVATHRPFLEVQCRRLLPIVVVTVMSRTHGRASYCSSSSPSNRQLLYHFCDSGCCVQHVGIRFACWQFFSELMLIEFNSSHRPSSLLLRSYGGPP